MVTHHSGTFEDAMHFFQRSLELYQGLGDPKSTADVLTELGHNSLRQGLLEQGETYIRRGCQIYEQTGDRASLADSLFHLSRMHFRRGKFSESLAIIDEIRHIFSELGWIERFVFNVVGKGFILAMIGDYETARQQGQQGLTAAREEKFLRYEALANWVLGIAELGLGEYLPAHDYLLQSVHLYGAIAQNNELGWAIACLAYAALELERPEEFSESLREAMQIGVKINALFTLLLALPAAALYFMRRGQAAGGQTASCDVERAIELYEVTRGYPVAAKSRFFEDVAGARISTAAASLPPDVIAAAQAHGRSRTSSRLLETCWKNSTHPQG